MASRAEAIAILEAGQSELRGLFARLGDAALEKSRTIGGGEWSAKDLMGHIAFWEELALNAIDACRAGHRAAADEFENADAANAHNQANTAAQSVSETRRRAAAAHAAIIAAIAAMDDAEWQAPPGCQDATDASLEAMVGGILSAPNRPFGHATAHVDDLRAYVASVV